MREPDALQRAAVLSCDSYTFRLTRLSTASAPQWPPTDPHRPKPRPRLSFRPRALNATCASWVWLSLIPTTWSRSLGSALCGRTCEEPTLVRARGGVVSDHACGLDRCGRPGSTLGGFLMILGWTGAIASSFALRASFKQLVVGSPFDAAVIAGEGRLRARARETSGPRTSGTRTRDRNWAPGSTTRPGRRSD